MDFNPSRLSTFQHDAPFTATPVVIATDKFLVKVKEVIHRYIDDEAFNSLSLSIEMSVSRSQLFRKIKAGTGYSTALYIRQVRLEKGAELLSNSDLPIKIIAYAVGFRDVAYFSRCFKQTFGDSPSHYRIETTIKVN